MDCLFCNIASGKIPSKKVYEDDIAYVFEDIAPMAPTHLLAIPKEHIGGPDCVGPKHVAVVGHLMMIAARTAKDAGLGAGYRIVANCGLKGGQTVDQLHYHILGGRQLSWPPG